MTVERARVIKLAVDVDRPVTPRPAAGVSANTGETRLDLGIAKRVAASIVDAHGESERILARARAHADAIISAAKASATSVAESAASEARERELARVAAEVLVFRSSIEGRAEREIDRTIEIAVLLAERLVGDAIAAEPARVKALALGALHETRGARQMRVEACPADVPELTAVLAELGEGVATVEPQPELARGSLVVHTELGRVDARLAPQLARLAEALREALRSPA
jgi:type III secretion protein L